MTKDPEFRSVDITLMLLLAYMNLGSQKIKTTDKMVREILISQLSDTYGERSLFQEFDIERGTVRADVVSVANDMVHGYEIKSDSDTLRRLPRQVKYYSRAFSAVTLVVGYDHIVEALYMVPDWWGILAISGSENGVRLNSIREAKRNENINLDTVSDLLHKSELVGILKEFAPGTSYSNMTKAMLKAAAISSVPRESFMECISNALIKRNVSYFA